jgi:hypothetical protein
MSRTRAQRARQTDRDGVKHLKPTQMFQALTTRFFGVADACVNGFTRQADHWRVYLRARGFFAVAIGGDHS